jgi:hypothetical protein
MKRLNLLVILLCLLVTYSCQDDEDNDPQSIGFELVEWNNCQPGYQSDRTSNVIRTEAEYTVLKDSIIMLSNECFTFDFPQIDFATHSLIGIQVGGTGCEVALVRDFLIDDENKKYIYRIDAAYTGACYLFIIDYNWIKVDKLKENYSVEFDVETTFETY